MLLKKKKSVICLRICVCMCVLYCASKSGKIRSGLYVIWFFVLDFLFVGLLFGLFFLKQHEPLQYKTVCSIMCLICHVDLALRSMDSPKKVC